MSDSSELLNPVEELASIILDFLPGPGPGYAETPASFQGIARKLKLHKHWQGNSKAQSVKVLCERTLKDEPDKFPLLLLKIIEAAKILHPGSDSLSAEQLAQISECLKKLEIVIPELDSPDLIKSLPLRTKHARPTQALSTQQLDLHSRMRIELVTLTRMSAEEQGYAFELFLNKLFANFGIRSLTPFRQKGEQIIGSVKFAEHLFCVHACWQTIFTQKLIQEILASLPLDSKCLLISMPDFLEPTKKFLAGKGSPNLIAADLRDLFLVLDGAANLEQMVELKLKAANKGSSFVFTQDLL